MQGMMIYRTTDEDHNIRACMEWKPAFRNTIKLYIDGSSNSNMAVGRGGVIRDHEAEWKGGFSKFVGRGSALLAEFLGLFEGIKLT